MQKIGKVCDSFNEVLVYANDHKKGQVILISDKCFKEIKALLNATATLMDMYNNKKLIIYEEK